MKRVGIILTVICILLGSVVVFADGGISVHAKLDVNDFYVDIQAEGLTAFSRISLIAVPENSSVISVMKSGSAPYIEQLEIGSDGVLKRHVAFLKNTKPGNYVIYLNDTSANKTYKSEPFSYLDIEKISLALKAFNSAKNADEMMTAIETYASDIGMDMTEYNDFEAGGTNRKKIAGLFLSLKPSGGYTSASDVQGSFGASAAVVALPLSDNPFALIEKYAENIGADISELKSCTQKERDEAMKFLQKKTFSVPDDIKTGIPEAVFVGKVNCADTAGKLQKYLLTDYSDVLNLDLSSYRRLNNPVNVFSYMLKEDVGGYDDAKMKFYSAVSSVASAESSNKGGGSSGSGGGSGSGSGGLPATGIKPADIPKTNSYSDMSGFEWAEDSVEFLTKRGVVNGDGNGLFHPGASVTRAEFIKMLVVAFDIPHSGEESEFDDVNASDWYAPYVASGVKYGIVKGISPKSFGSANKISREDLTVMCARAAEYAQMSIGSVRSGKPSDFESVSDYAKDAVESFYLAGIINGDTNAAFRPHDGATRAEAAKIIAGLLTKREALK